MNWNTPQKPAEITETRLIEAILNGHFSINSTLPGERELAAQLGVTRPTLREALQRLARDGWVEINQGKPTRVCNYWQEGNLAVLASIARHQANIPDDFVNNLLAIRQLMAPSYARAAIENNPKCLLTLLTSYPDLPEEPEAYAEADWELHRQMTICSGNPVFTLILNGFQDLYPVMGRMYFQNSEARSASQRFYLGLLNSAQSNDPDAAEQVTRQAMETSSRIWNSLVKGSSPDGKIEA
jgi:GntR family negative regulator for fad regulon and positive regulator of fabA